KGGAEQPTEPFRREERRRRRRAKVRRRAIRHQQSELREADPCRQVPNKLLGQDRRDELQNQEYLVLAGFLQRSESRCESRREQTGRNPNQLRVLWIKS